MGRGRRPAAPVGVKVSSIGVSLLPAQGKNGLKVITFARGVGPAPPYHVRVGHDVGRRSASGFAL